MVNNPVYIDFTPYFVVNRKTGSSYDVTSQGVYSLSAYSNNCLEGHVYIDLNRLVKGLKERRYRLIPKRLPSKVMYRGVVKVLNAE